MDADTFRNILTRAVEGDMTAMEQLLLLYNPLIDHRSVIHGELDEDCRQEILLHLLNEIRNFRI